MGFVRLNGSCFWRLGVGCCDARDVIDFYFVLGSFINLTVEINTGCCYEIFFNLFGRTADQIAISFLHFVGLGLRLR